MQVKLQYSQRTTTGTAKGTMGLVAYLNNTPLYMDALYQIYTYSRILAVDIHIEAINLDSVPYDFVVAVCPQTEISSLTLDQAKQSQGSILKTIGTAAGMNRIIIRKHYDVEKLIGYYLADRDTRMTFADANNASQSDTSLPAIVFFPSAITGSATNGVSISVVQTFHVVFYDLYVPATSAIQQPKHKPLEQMEEDEPSPQDDDDFVCSRVASGDDEAIYTRDEIVKLANQSLIRAGIVKSPNPTSVQKSKNLVKK
jgi:hypothetical protein